MQLDGTFTIAASRLQVWEAIRDPGLMARCIPGCEAAEKISEDRYHALIGIKIGPISAKFNLVIDVEEEAAPESIRSKASGEEGSRASMLTARNFLSLMEIESNLTEVSWSSDVNVTGRLGKYGLGLMKKKAKSLSDEFVTVFEKRVETGAVTS